MQYSNKDHTFAVCAYGESPYLPECIASLLRQTDSDSIIITTSSPNQFIREVADKYNIKLYIRDGQSNIADDWNFAYESAQAKLITIVHQDDIYLEDYKREMIEKINSSKKPLIAFSNYMELRGETAVTDNHVLNIKKIMLRPLSHKNQWGKVWVRRRILSLGNPICCPSVMYVKDNLETPLFSKGLRSNLDWETWERISRCKGDFVYCNQQLMEHRIHPDSTTTALISENKRSDEDYVIFRRFWPALFARMLTRFYSESEKSNDL